MEFDKSKCYSAINADELHEGDKVIVGDTLDELQRCIGVEKPTPIVNIKSIDEMCRFNTKYGGYALAYLVECKENCTNCGRICGIGHKEELKTVRCDGWMPKTEQKAEKHYRPFKDIDELLKVWCEHKCPAHNHRERDMTMPLIWVKYKGDDTDKGRLIINYSNNGCSVIDVDEIKVMLWKDLFEECVFLDGSPCGVEE